DTKFEQFDKDKTDSAGTASESKITRDADGKVTDVTYPGGKSRHIAYDDSEPRQPREIKSNDGKTWTKEADGWNQYGPPGPPDGKKTGLHVDAIEVSGNGDITLSKKGDETLVLHPDGSKTGILIDKSVVTVDARGDVTDVTYPGGKKSRHITYDDSEPRQPREIKSNDAKTWMNEADGWNQYGPPGPPNGKKTGQHVDAIEVSKEGGITLSTKGDTTIVLHRHGSKTGIFTDKSVVTVNAGGRVTDVTYPDGHSNHIEYDHSQPPQLCAIKSIDGAAWKIEADGWDQYGPPDGKTKTGLHRDVITVSED